jgi:hypothetical protein
MSELQDFRADKDEYFRHHPQSPLTHEQRAAFEGLSYYAEVSKEMAILSIWESHLPRSAPLGAPR